MGEPSISDALVTWLAGRDETPTIVETHVSVLAFTSDRVYKVKKPVSFEFLDLSTPELREADCHREIALNRRLTPDVYEGVVEVLDASGAVVDHAVEMRRMPDDRRLSTLVRGGVDASGCIDAIADAVARFHASAATSPEISQSATRSAAAELWEKGFAEVRPFVGPVLEAGPVAHLETLVRRYLSGRDPLFDARIAAGHSRDGHGDLLADDIFCLDDGPRILDCLEFDDRLRYGDVLADVAFLAMDLELLGRPDLARRFLDTYRVRTGDAWPTSLEHLYVAYRAHVRAKVACLRHSQHDPGAAARARARFSLAVQHLEAGRVRLVLVGGLPGTGKSTLAADLSERTGMVLLRSDVTRKALAKIEPLEREGSGFREGLYGPTTTDAVYRALLDAAQEHLALGESVILDASWSSAAHRHAAEAMARSTASDLLQLRCEAPPGVAAARIDTRVAGGEDASDATPAIAAAMARRFDPWPDATTIDTAGPLPAQSLDLALALLARQGRGVV